MGHSDLKNYTISADVRGARMSDQLPDIGLTAHGYVLDLMGESRVVFARTLDLNAYVIAGIFYFATVLVFDQVWAAPRPLGEQDLLVLPGVGQSIDRHRIPAHLASPGGPGSRGCARV